MKMKIFSLLVVFILVNFCNAFITKKTFIVHMERSKMPTTFTKHTHWFDSSLKSVSKSAEMIYTYTNAIHGFSTQLTEDEAKALQSLPGILSVLPEIKYELHTTRTPEFLGLDKSAGFFPASDIQSEVIVGVLDTGVWPESKSFDDSGLGPVPSTWKGACEEGTNFNKTNCNRKLIGARFFSKGVSLYKGQSLPSTLLPFIYAGNASNATNGNLCMMGSLIPEKVSGKIVLCDRGVNARVQKGAVVKAAGGAGMVLANTAANGEELVADAHLLPATLVGEKNGDEIKNYLFSDPNPTVTILLDGTKVGVEPSPVVAAFSSRGPNSITPEILKPDLIAPGVNILAGWSGAVGPTGLAVDTRRVGFNIISGTSMSCPHVSGLAALIKAAHPEWSPAAIRSALMTTAYTAYKNGKIIEDISTGKAATPFDFGAGHVDPLSALNPGLLYDITTDDYLNFLCSLNYTASQISTVSRKNFTCDDGKKYSVTELNYPSFAVPLQSAEGGFTVVKYTRTLTNVGSVGTYKVTISSPSESVKISVNPESLTFSEKNEKQSYTVTFTASSMAPNTNIFGRIEWSDGTHVVGSPVAFG
ncbi:Peptidase S8/S53 domain [Dillenia turbinata]|uniref:Peptidase S8/S53 domain n=1 Tax=Dillenia turbinata TaxID=194707 RepID=A0AAN8Z5B8_9MAGN